MSLRIPLMFLAGGVSLSACVAGVVARDGAFSAGDACDQLVLDAIAQADELRWEREHLSTAEGEFLDIASGYDRKKGELTSKWILYRSGGQDRPVLVRHNYSVEGDTLTSFERTRAFSCGEKP